MSEQLPGPQYHTSPLPPVPPQSQQPPLIPTPVSNASSRFTPEFTPEVPQQPPTSFPIRESSSTTPGPNRKRARPTVSCLECRRKKLRCDRSQPCNQCVKGRREDLCQFAAGAGPVGVSPARLQPVIAARKDDGERAGKRMRIEDVMASNSVPRNERDQETNRGDASTTGSTLGRIYVKENRSRYLGFLDRMAMLDHFEDAKSYIMNSFKEQDTVGMMFELSGYQNSFQRKPKKTQIQLPHDRASLLSEMLKSIPNDGLIASKFVFYESHWEGLTRVFHKPTFTQEVNAFEAYLNSHSLDENFSLPQHIRESLIPQVMGICVLTARFEKLMSKYISEDQIAIWMEMMQRWLEILKGKEKLNIQTLRVQVLLLMSKITNLVQTSDLWRESATLVRSAMILGLHHDPERYDVFSQFEKEQRRKLWRTIVELELQLSLSLGMPSAIRSSDFNSRPLRNVDDLTFKEEIATYPESQPDGLWTDSFPQIVMEASVKERLDATNILAGNINTVEDKEKLLSLARYFEHSIQNLLNPSHEENDRGGKSERSPGILFKKIMLDVHLRRPTLCIYQSIMLRGESSQYAEARKGALRNAIAMLNHLDALDPEVADPNAIRSRDQLNLFHVLCKKEIIQAAMILCLEIRSLRLGHQNGGGLANGGQTSQDDLLPWTKISLTRIVENTLNSLLLRVGEFGSDLKDILPLSVVLQSARSDGSPEDKRALMKKGTERVLKACRETNMLATPATSHEGTTPIKNMDQYVPSRPPPYGSNDSQNQNQYNPVGPEYGFGDLNIPPGNDLTFQDFDFGFADGDMNEPWF